MLMARVSSLPEYVVTKTNSRDEILGDTRQSYRDVRLVRAKEKGWLRKHNLKHNNGLLRKVFSQQRVIRRTSNFRVPAMGVCGAAARGSFIRCDIEGFGIVARSKRQVLFGSSAAFLL